MINQWRKEGGDTFDPPDGFMGGGTFDPPDGFRIQGGATPPEISRQIFFQI